MANVPEDDSPILEKSIPGSDGKKTMSHASVPKVVVEDDRTGMSPEALRRAVIDHLKCSQGTDKVHATSIDVYQALSYTVRDRLVDRWIKTRYAIEDTKEKIVCYLSAEFLMGRQLGNNLLNIGCFRPTREALFDLGFSVYDILEQESEPGLGNGGLGRLAACFLDSLATLNIPAFGYGIRYEFGIFEQAIQDGWQIERPDKWLRFGSPWEIARPQLTVEIGLGGRTEKYVDEKGKPRTRWIPGRTVLGEPYDTMIPGFSTNMVNTLRLWSAGTSRDFDFQIFNDGDYARAVEEKTFSENISKVLYPNDSTLAGRELRLEQQYFFVACSLKDMLRRHLRLRGALDTFAQYQAVQLNDTHPAIAVAELMRLLVDEHGYDWAPAWSITTNTFGYTNHTLLSEALECWPVALFGSLLPRHLEIIYEINSRFLDEVQRRFPSDENRLRRMSIIEEGAEKKVRMAHLATVGSHAVNGVAELHSELVKKLLLKDFYEMWPEKFTNVTNGITPRRWLLLCNPKLTLLISDRIGKSWVKNLDELRALEDYAEDSEFGHAWHNVKGENKADLAAYILLHNQVRVDPETLFDVQVKRLHEYKRQLLNLLYVIAIYNRLKANPNLSIQPRTIIFGAKAAPGYLTAKLIIKLINSVGDVINNDPSLRDQLKVVFLSNFCVSLGEAVYPSADLSEQISLAGKEASGTGNMKFSLNGALTIGTYDGANIEIRDAVGADNFFLFGMKVADVERVRASGYVPMEYYRSNSELRGVIDAIANGVFSRGDKQLFKPIVDSLLYRDEYMLLADFASYLEEQQKVSDTFMDRRRWTKMSILNVARMGKFSSDRSISEYCANIWNVRPIKVKISSAKS